MKKSVLLIALAFGVSNVFAQLSTRENDERVEKIGARPKAGDMAFVFGMSLSSDSGKAKLFDGNSLRSGNVLTYKWYMEDDLVIRFGIRLMNENMVFKGTSLDSSASYNPNGVTGPGYVGLKEVTRKTKNRMYEIVPGVEKHFLASNIFDAYAGADLYLGFGRDMTTSNFDYINGDKSYTTTRTPTTDVGLGVVTGFNVFIAHLPVSLGLEYGWNAKWTFGGIDKVKSESIVGTTSTSEEYKQDNSTSSESNARYSKLKRREFNAETNQDVRIVLHIYFGK
jgi:hypothetical protein